MSYILIMKALHVIGAILWVGGVATVAAVAMGLPERLRDASAESLRTAISHVVTPGMGLAFLGGLAMLIPNFMDIYVKQGWVHAKLLLVLIMAALTGVITGAIRKSVRDGAELPVTKLRAMGMTVMALGILSVVLATLRPF